MIQENDKGHIRRQSESQGSNETATGNRRHAYPTLTNRNRKQTGQSDLSTCPSPSPLLESLVEKNRRTGKLYMTGVVAALAVTLHNLPEGLAVYLAALKDGGENHGSLFFGIFLHNIPEGLAVAMPLYAATGSKWRSVLWATLSGLAEPLGALVMGPFLGQLPEDRIQGVLAAVAGIMIYISLSELYPTALDHIDGQKATLSCYAGMFVVFLAIHVLGH